MRALSTPQSPSRPPASFRRRSPQRGEVGRVPALSLVGERLLCHLRCAGRRTRSDTRSSEGRQVSNCTNVLLRFQRRETTTQMTSPRRCRFAARAALRQSVSGSDLITRPAPHAPCQSRSLDGTARPRLLRGDPPGADFPAQARGDEYSQLAGMLAYPKQTPRVQWRTVDPSDQLPTDVHAGGVDSAIAKRCWHR